MKKVVFYLVIIGFMSCSENPMSPTETAKVVVESFYNKDNNKLKAHTTTESYESFLAIQNIMTSDSPDSSNFEVLEETSDGETAWVKFKTSYEEKPETFKLVKVDGKWKVAEIGLREETPF